MHLAADGRFSRHGVGDRQLNEELFEETNMCGGMNEGDMPEGCQAAGVSCELVIE